MNKYTVTPTGCNTLILFTLTFPPSRTHLAIDWNIEYPANANEQYMGGQEFLSVLKAARVMEENPSIHHIGLTQGFEVYRIS